MGRGDSDGSGSSGLAEEILRSLFDHGRRRGGGRGRPGTGDKKRPEWRCECGTTNFEDRNVCRRCAQRRPPGCSARVPNAGEWPALPGNDGSKGISPGKQAEAFSQAAAKARRAGAPPEAIEPLQAEERAARQRQLDRKVDAKVERARAAAARADAEVAAADVALAAAQRRLQEARVKADAAATRLQEEEAAAATGPAPALGDSMFDAVEDLLAKLENGGFAAAMGLPEPVLAAMAVVQQGILAAKPPMPAAALDQPLTPDVSQGPMEVRRAAAAGVRKADDVSACPDNMEDDGGEVAKRIRVASDLMTELKGLEETDEAGYAAAAKAAMRRLAPY